MTLEKIIRRLFYIVLILFVTFVLYVFTKVLLFDCFPVSTTSMTPTIQPGDRIVVNKMIFGARIYKSLDFKEGKPLESWRMPGWRKIRHNDIVVFNYVRGEDRNRISFNFSTVYVKRCIGLPGDTVYIRNGFFHNSNAKETLGVIELQEELSNADTLTLFKTLKALKYARPHSWTIMNLGPLYIPEKGGVIKLIPLTYQLYKSIIEYETQGKIIKDGEAFILNGTTVDRYEFRNNYYFMCGDYLVDSADSRLWGFVPEDFIIGVSPRVLYAKDKQGKMDWDRFLKSFSRNNPSLKNDHKE